MSPARVYLSTTIPYVNGRPHLGHALELVQADVLARHHRLAGDQVRFQTGTDDNSLKNVLAAQAEGVSTRELVDRNASAFAELRGPLALSFDDFIRTSSDPRHLPGVERLWRACAASGDLYRRHYEGLYCVGCEQFYKPAELPGGRCPEHGTVPQRVAEENWFFRLSRYTGQLHELISSGRLRIEPAARRNEVLGFIGGGLDDFSVSRSTGRARGWGIPVPGDPGQVVYVWWDALGNYITSLGYGVGAAPGAGAGAGQGAGAGAAPGAGAGGAPGAGQGAGAGAGRGTAAGAEAGTGTGVATGDGDYQRWWAGADRRMHLVGKGVLRFHAVYWPAILLSAAEPLPTDILVHDYLTINGQKISKSAAAAVPPASGGAGLADPAALADKFGTDAVRWWLLREVPRVGDADFTIPRLVARANDDLANGIGNLISRVVSLVHRYRDGKVPRSSGEARANDGAGALRAAWREAPGGISAALAAFDFRAAIAAVWDTLEEANRYVERAQPWNLAKAERAGDACAGHRLDAVLDALVTACRVLARQVEPFVPDLAAGIAAACDDSAGRLPDPRPLFPRLE